MKLQFGTVFTLTSGFNLEGLSSETQKLVHRYVWVSSLIRAILILSDTFLILYVIDEVGYSISGTLVAIMLFTQAVIDYPSGILSDWMGQRWVLALAFSSYAVSFYLFSIADDFTSFVIAYLFFALASAQESGALDSWFDNNYRNLSDDENREIYKGIKAKIRTVIDLAGAAMLILGGYLATTISRKFVFQVQIIGMIILVVTVLLVVKNSDQVGPEELKHSYISLFKEGITAVVEDRQILLIVIGFMFYTATLGVFGYLIMYPAYFGYTGTDFGASIFRFTLFVAGSIILWILADFFRRLKPETWLGGLTVFHAIFFFGMAAIVLYFIPIRGVFDLGGIIIFAFLITVGHSIRMLISILLQSIYIDLIPNYRRNGFYSLLPTLTLLINAPLMAVSGWVIENYGFIPITIILLLLSLGSGVLFWAAVSE